MSENFPHDGADILFCSDVQQLEDFASRTGTHGLRLPLQLALAVSPCMLFVQTMLHKQEVSRLSLIQASPWALNPHTELTPWISRYGKAWEESGQ
jgi:hypothetical protein